MGMIGTVLALLFGGQRNVVRDTVEVFRENTEAGSERAQEVQLAALAQLGAEFSHPRSGAFDRFIDGLNRLPRPCLALGTLGLLASAMVDPIWFAARMQGIALVPEPLWWLLGVIVTFYFGARHQAKNFHQEKILAGSLATLPRVLENLEQLADHDPAGQHTPAVHHFEEPASAIGNPALGRWQEKLHEQKA